jgi:hypothetical protein
MSSGGIIVTKNVNSVFKGYNYLVYTNKIDYSQDQLDKMKLLGLSMPTEWVTGYVKVKEDKISPELLDFYEDNIECHGGITYNGTINDEIGQWIGFDCNHACDTNNPKDVKYAEEECKIIIYQLINGSEDLKKIYRIQ